MRARGALAACASADGQSWLVGDTQHAHGSHDGLVSAGVSGVWRVSGSPLPTEIWGGEESALGRRSGCEGPLQEQAGPPARERLRDSSSTQLRRDAGLAGVGIHGGPEYSCGGEAGGRELGPIPSASSAAELWAQPLLWVLTRDVHGPWGRLWGWERRQQ